MKIILPHKIHSKKVNSLKEIMADADAMAVMIREGKFAKGQRAFAVHHSQVSKDPFNFFIVAEPYRHAFDGKHLIVNPKIVDMKDARETSEESCLSYPFRPPKKMKRYYRILLQCEIENEFGDLEGKMFDLQGIPAYIAQHECDHAHAKFIYDK